MPPRSGRAASLVLAICGALAATVAVAEDAASPEEAYLQARTELVPKLEAHAAWCSENRCPAERRRAFEAILAVDPDHAAARKALRSTKGKDGRWSPPAAPLPPGNDKSRTADLEAHREDAIGGYRASVLALLAEAGTAPVVRERAIEELVGVAPDDAAARETNREVLVGGTWLLAETVSAQRRGPELVRLLKECNACAAVPKPFQPSGVRTTLGVKWEEAFGNDSVKVLGGPGTHEALDVAKTITAMRPIYTEIFGAPPITVPDFHILLFAHRDEGLAAMDRDPRFTPGAREFARNLAGTWTDKGANDVYIWVELGPDRVEGSMRQMLMASMSVQFGLRGNRGWVDEGFGHWFSGAICGTHRCFFVRPSEYASGTSNASGELKDRLSFPGADWLGEARDLDRTGAWPDLRALLARDVNSLTAEDVLVSYCLARYLIEGRPGDLDGVLRAVGRSEGADAWTASRMRATIEGLDRRLRRWVREMK